MNSRKIHKTLGLILILPMLGWVITGVIFFIKPGYQGAYHQLAVKTYPLVKSFIIPAATSWQEVRLIKTILGEHLLVKSNNKNQHLDPISLLPQAVPTPSEYKLLLQDAVASHIQRYGDIVSIDNQFATTSEGVTIKLDWPSLTLRQTGQDTKIINLIYKIHYLQWTPFKVVNQILGMIGLLLLISLTTLGIRIYVASRTKDIQHK